MRPMIHDQERRQLIKALLALAASNGLNLDAFAAGNKPLSPGINKLSGDVHINGQPASIGQLVGPGDTVTTGSGAEAVYVIGADAYLQRGSSRVSFATNALRIISGRLLSVFGKGEQKITTPTATIGIRGTGCYIEAAGEGKAARVYFCLCYGSAELTPLAAPQQRETITTQHHDHPLWIGNDPAMPSMMAHAEVVNHTDMELMMLEALVGRRPPFADTLGYAGGYY